MATSTHFNPVTTTFNPVTTTYVPQEPSIASQFLDGMINIGTCAGTGALAGYLFGIINPVGGAVFGGTSALISLTGSKIAQKAGVHSNALKVALYVASFIASIAVSAMATTALGFPLTILGGVVLTLAMVVSGFAMKLAVGGAKCAGACAAGGALALKERFC